MADGILLTRDGAIARITLDRPDQGNALDIPMARALLKAAIACDADASVRCVLMAGRGKLFCAGGDIAAFSQAGEKLPAFLKEITASLHAAIACLARMEQGAAVTSSQRMPFGRPICHHHMDSRTTAIAGTR